MGCAGVLQCAISALLGTLLAQGIPQDFALRFLNADMAGEFPLLQAELLHCAAHNFPWW
jgi:hypothetical protein